MNIAVEGCLHGQLTQVYNHLLTLQKRTNIQIDLLLICGDFQATRDLNDLQYMHCPPKYKEMGSFQEYFSGNKKAPFLTIFIGGNHEAVNYMRDLYFGGWVAQNIYYLGQAGSIIVKKGEKKLRITGLSGIYNHRDFQFVTRTQNIPLYGKDRITAYHTKQIDIFRLQLLGRICEMQKQSPEIYGKGEEDFDIFLSHDWPKDMALYGNMDKLLKYKPFLKKQINDGEFGSPPLTRLVEILKPNYWFSAHMHIKYAALFPHKDNLYTHFLALDKCLQNRSCLQFIKMKQNKIQDENEEPEIKESEQEIQKVKEKVKIEIETDKVWFTVLQLTAELQKQNLTLYKYNNRNLGIHNAKLMNQMIEMYPKTRANLKDFSIPEFAKQYEQINQTIDLFKNLSINLETFEGIIFDKVEKSKEVDEKCEDQIQLQL